MVGVKLSDLGPGVEPSFGFCFLVSEQSEMVGVVLLGVVP